MSFEDPANLEFLRRPEQRSRRMKPFSSQSIWLAIAIVAAIVFVLFVRAMLERSAWTAGHSPEVASQEWHVSSDAQPNAQDWSQLPQPEVTQPRGAVSSQESHGRALVYRCVGKRGAVSFQSQPCGAGESTTRVLDATPEYERPPQVIPRSSNPSATQQYSYGSTATSDERAERRANCESAKRNRDATLERAGLTRTYELLQRLDAIVYEACKGL